MSTPKGMHTRRISAVKPSSALFGALNVTDDIRITVEGKLGSA